MRQPPLWGSQGCENEKAVHRPPSPPSHHRPLPFAIRSLGWFCVGLPFAIRWPSVGFAPSPSRMLKNLSESRNRNQILKTMLQHLSKSSNRNQKNLTTQCSKLSSNFRREPLDPRWCRLLDLLQVCWIHGRSVFRVFAKQPFRAGASLGMQFH